MVELYSRWVPLRYTVPPKGVYYILKIMIYFTEASDVVNPIFKTLRPRPHVSGDFCIRQFFYADTKISASTRSVYELYTTVHTYPIRIRTSQRISNRACALQRKLSLRILAPNLRLSSFLSFLFVYLRFQHE